MARRKNLPVPKGYPMSRIDAILRPHRRRIYELFDLYFNSRKGKTETQNHNDLIKIRNTICEEFLDAYRDISFKQSLPRGARIHESPRKLHQPQPCALCGDEEDRKRVHIIPLRLGGSESAANVVYLCPRHKEMFSHKKLSSGDWEKLKKHVKDEAAFAYLEEIVEPQQELYWKNLTKLPPPSGLDS